MGGSTVSYTYCPFIRGFTHTLTNLQDGEVLQDAVHHVLLREVLESMDEADHVVTHRGTVDTVNETTRLKPCILRLKLTGERGEGREREGERDGVQQALSLLIINNSMLTNTYLNCSKSYTII